MMKQNYLKSLFLMLMMCIGMGAWAEEVTFTFSDVASELTWENGVAQTNVTLDNFTFTVNGGGNNGKYYTSDVTWRFYSGGGLSITPADGYIITGVTSNPSQSFTVSNGTATTSFSATVKFKSITIKYTTTGGSTTDPTTTYNVTIASNITGGSIKANPASAVAGTKITLNATPNEGYEFGGWNVTGATVADASSTETTFTMPAANVNVSATFNELQEEGTETASFIFNTDEGLSALGIAKPATSKGTNLESNNYKSGAITMTATDGGTATRVWNSNGNTTLRVYTGSTGKEGTLTFSGATITKIVFNANVPMTASVGSLASGTWTGETESVTFTATSGVTINTIKVTYKEIDTPSDKTLSSIAISGTPNKTTYIVGDTFDPTGLTVTGTYSDNSTEVFTKGITWSTPETLTAGQTSVKITATVNGVTSGEYTVNGLTVNTIPEKTIAEFIASEGGKCYLTGTVSNIANTTYGNFDLTDESGTLYIYGCLNAAGEAKKFAELDVVAGDKIKVLAETYEYFNNTTHEAKNVIFVEELEIEKPQYTVTIETPENGTLVVKEGENVLTSGTKVEEGLTLTIECAPTSEDYRYKNWQYKEDGDWVTMTKNMTRVVTKDITIRANFEAIPTYAIAWNVNGTVVKTENLKEGATVTAPEVEAINGKVFTGWVATETVAADATPSYVTPTIADKDATYYAVFATVEGEGGEAKVHELTQQELEAAYVGSGDNKTTSYGNHNFGESWSGSCIINKYNNVYFVQIRKNIANNYILTPDFGDAVKSITINTTASNSSTSTPANREFYLRQNNETAQPTSGDYGSGAITEDNGSVTIDVTGEPHQFYIYANGGAYIKSITVNYGGGASYSDFTTTVSAPVTKYNVTISDDIENGTVTVDKETAAEGETVTLTITPEDGYALAQLMVYTDYDDVDVEGNTFVMPASDVEVYAYFAPAASETYTLSELAEADIEPYSVVSVSFDNEIIDIQMDEEEGGYIALKDGDNTFVLQTYYACNAEWTAGGTLSGTWENVYYAEQGGAYILMNDSDEPWAGLTYTAPVAPVNGTLAFKATNEEGYWATFSCDKDVIFDANDVIVYTVAVDDNQIVMIEANNNSLSCVTDKTKDEGWVAGYYVQAGAAVLINSVDESVNYYFIDTDPFTSNDLNEVETDPEYNMLVPCTSDGIFKAEADGNMYYKLAYGDNTSKTKLGFWWGADDGSANFKVKAGGAVLCVPQATATSVKGFSFDMAKDEDAIKGVEQKSFDTVIYDMQGRKVSKAQKGLYIVNGRKMVK